MYSPAAVDVIVATSATGSAISRSSACPIAVTQGIRGENSLRDSLSVERFKLRITLPTTADDGRVNVLRPVEVVDAVCDGCLRVRALVGGVLHQDVDGRVLFVDCVLNVIAGITTERSDDTDSLRECRRLLFLLIIKPATLFEFAS